MKETLKRQWSAKVVFTLFILFTAFWLLLQIGVFNGMTLFDHTIHKFFGAIYGVVALWGGVWGIIIAHKWGGHKSVLGRGLYMFGIGLLLQEFGQISLSYLDYVYHIAGAYPSVGDIGYFGSIFFYIAGILMFAQAAGVKFGLQTIVNKFKAVSIPLIALSAGYILFLKDYTLDWSDPVKVGLDLGYPLLQAFYVSLALLTYFLTRGVLGGIMKNRIAFILTALSIQFLADYTFLYQSAHGTWTVGGINDYMYLAAYFFMSFGLMQFKTVFDSLKKI